MVTYDATIFPSNATYVRQSGLTAANVLAMSGSNFCHAQFPALQAQTSVAALVKHRRLLEDQFFRSNLNIVNGAQLLFTKPESGRDSRGLSQPCLAMFHNNFDSPQWLSSVPIKEGKLGPVSLIKFSDFIGFDDTNRPSAQARVEQMLVCFSSVFASFPDICFLVFL